jgi:glycosyltransferase involved in cell wall biosynthesis
MQTLGLAVSPPLHIALVGPLYPYRGGIAHFTHSLGRRLEARGHRLSPVTFHRQYPEFLFPGRTQFETSRPPDAFDAPRLLDTINPVSWERTARHLRGLAPDAVVFQYWMSFLAPSLGSVARRLGEARRLAVVHNALPHERRPGDRALGRYALGAMGGLLVLSESVRRDVEGLAPGVPVRQAAHPVYDFFGDPVPRGEARAALGLPADAPVLLFFGFVRRYKGLHVLLDALPQIRVRVPRVRLVVAGEFYDDAAPYRQQVRHLGLEDVVRFDAEYVPNERVAPYFGAADLVVQPYLSATQSGVANVAYHFERPLVTTDVGGLAETVPSDAGLVVPPEDPAALADAVARFFERRLAGRLAEGVRRMKADGGWDGVCAAVEALATGTRQLPGTRS